MKQFGWKHLPKEIREKTIERLNFAYGMRISDECMETYLKESKILNWMTADLFYKLFARIFAAKIDSEIVEYEKDGIIHRHCIDLYAKHKDFFTNPDLIAEVRHSIQYFDSKTGEQLLYNDADGNPCKDDPN